MAQRITTGMMTSSYLRGLSGNMNRLIKLQNQMITNSKYEKFSDNPVAAVYGLQARARLARNAQYTDNVADARSWLTEAENNVKDFSGLMEEVYANVIDWSTDAKTGDDRATVAAKVKELRDHLVQLANGTFNTKYVFGGYNTVNPPFAVDEATGILCYKGVPMYSDDPTVDVSADFAALGDEHIQFEVGFSIYMNVNLTGVEVMGLNDKNMYKMLDDLYNALTATEDVFIDPDQIWLGTETKYSSTADDINDFIKPLQQEQQRMLAYLGELGGRANRLDLLEARYALDEVNYTEIMSHYEDADVEKVYLDFTNAMNTYNAALAFGSRVIPASLVNFLQ